MGDVVSSVRGGMTEPEWDSPDDLQEHFEAHGALLDCQTVEAYDESARATMDEGTFFNYQDRSTGEWRLGYYDRLAERFTAVNEDGDTIVTHFRCDERYVRGLPENDYR
jgi:pyocin large subunit-like protein